VTRLARIVLNSRLNLLGAVVSTATEIGSWFTALDDPYRVTPIAFILTVYFLGMLCIREHSRAEQLKDQIAPRLMLVFRPELGEPYFTEPAIPIPGYAPPDVRIERIYRVGVVNHGSNTAPSVRVLLRAFSPLEEDVRLKLPMVVMEAPNVLSNPDQRCDINHSDEPQVFFQVVSQIVFDPFDSMKIGRPKLQQATRDEPILTGRHQLYKLALEIDGPGAGAPMGFVYEADKRGVYELRENPFSKL